MLGILSQHEIEDLLKNGMLVRIACRNQDSIYIVPVTYSYTPEGLLCHSYEGQKIDWMRINKQVGLEVEFIKDNRNWLCATGQGFYDELIEQTEIDSARHLFNEIALLKKASLTASLPTETTERYRGESQVSVYYRIRITSITGRFERSI